VTVYLLSVYDGDDSVTAGVYSTPSVAKVQVKKRVTWLHHEDRWVAFPPRSAVARAVASITAIELDAEPLQ
jgi:hypothetical protein